MCAILSHMDTDGTYGLDGMHIKYAMKVKESAYLASCYLLARDSNTLPLEYNQRLKKYIITSIVRIMKDINVMNECFDLGYGHIEYTKEVDGTHVFLSDKDIASLPYKALCSFRRVNAERGIMV